MTQRIFKKSNKKDMIDLFNILPDWIQLIRRTDINNNFYSLTFYGINNEIFELERNPLFKIDFETNRNQGMYIQRPKEDNDK